MMIVLSFSIVTLLLIGLISGLYIIKRISSRIRFTQEFGDRFARCVSSAGSDDFGENYAWLNNRLPKLSEEIGSYGMIQYKPPFANYIHKNYLIVPNTIMKIGTGMADSGDMKMTAAILMQHVGRLEDQKEAALRRLKNPFFLFTDGVSIILSFPVWILAGSGVIKPSSVRRFRETRIARFITAIISIITLLSAVMTIALGWDTFVDLAKDILRITRE